MNTETKQITESEILKDDNLLCSLKLKKYSISVFLIYQGTSTVVYYMFFKNKLLFNGNDFRPAPSYGIDSLESITSLLSFLTMQDGDVEDEYFKDYTPEQMAFTKTIECYDLKTLLFDIENEDSECHKQTTKDFKKGFKTY